MSNPTNYPRGRFPAFFLNAFAAALIISSIGCSDPPQKADTGIINKKTQDIGEFDADGDAKIADLQVKPSGNPFAAAGAYGYAVSEISKLQIKQALGLFEAEHGRMPKDLEEFMTRIIKQNNIELPVLPGKRRYQYDVENHELVVVEAEKKTEAK